ncbi:MAG: cytochrome-c peroxidase, partial [Ramlibacter sp.]
MKLNFATRLTQLLAAMAAVALAACGGGAGSGSAGPAPASTDAAASASATGTTSSAGNLVLSPLSASLLQLDGRQLPDYAPKLPAHFAGVEAQDNTPAGTVSTPTMATLGRVLFYDKNLSVNGQVSCASCHNQAQDLGDAGRFSKGFDGGLTGAHAMRLANVRYYQPGTMFWDKRAASLETQATMPVQHPVEMGFDASHGG